MAANRVRVVKVGGSLFDFTELKARLSDWLAAQLPATNVLIAGGGPVVDSIRDIDARHGLGETAAHWLCVRAMSVTARLLVDLLDDVALVDELHGLKELLVARPTRTCVFDATPLLLNEEPDLPGTPLPHGWQVTSDSIAARVAQVLAAQELVLLKSESPAGESLAELAAAGYVDPFFPSIAEQLANVRAVNLRANHVGQVFNLSAKEF